MALESQSDRDMKVSDVFGGMPLWVRAAALLGAPTVAAGYLIWLISGSVASDVRAMRDQITTHTISTAALTDKIAETRTDQSYKLEVLIRLMQTQCVNAATDVVQRRNCIDAGGR